MLNVERTRTFEVAVFARCYRQAPRSNAVPSENVVHIGAADLADDECPQRSYAEGELVTGHGAFVLKSDAIRWAGQERNDIEGGLFERDV